MTMIYLFVMVEVTPIADRDLFRSFEDRYYDWNERTGIQYEFIDYLLDEDKTYVHVPAHQAYSGQVSIIDRLLNRQKAAEGMDEKIQPEIVFVGALSRISKMYFCAQNLPKSDSAG